MNDFTRNDGRASDSSRTDAQAADERPVLIEAKDLCKYFPVGGGRVLKAVDRVSFVIRSGETLGLVGESGCGKSTTGRTLLGLYPRTSGEIRYGGTDIGALKGRELKEFRRQCQIIFQDPYSSLDPRMTIAEIVAEGIRVFEKLSKEEIRQRVNSLLARVGLTEDFANRFAHELSGGQRQRVGIARALAVSPRLIVCDEPISALDVSIQAQIINLLLELQREEGLSYLFISHDLSMVRHISDRVGIMYLGSLVELGSSDQVFRESLHPYTRALIAAIPDADPDAAYTKGHSRLEGEVPSPVDSPSGCRFRTRCPYAQEACAADIPPMEEAAPGHFVACRRWRELQ